MSKSISFILFLFIVPAFSYAQTDTSKTQPPTWNDVRNICSPTTKTVAPHFLDVYFMHRFGSIGEASNGGIHTLYGFDVASDILFGFDIAISKRIMVGIARSKQQELIDVYGKYRFLNQKKGGSPISMAIYEDIGVIPEADNQFYGSTSIPPSRQTVMDRLDYLTQVIIDTRINKHISVEIIPTLSHRNHTLESINYNNDSFDANDIPAIAVGGRYMFTKQIGLVADYYYVISTYRTNNPYLHYYNPLSFGLEVFTGGHVFEITLSNSSGLLGNNFIPSTTDTWTKGGFKLGFTIMRAFNI